MLRKTPGDLQPTSPGVSLLVYLNAVVCLVQHNQVGFVSVKWLNVPESPHMGLCFLLL